MRLLSRPRRLRNQLAAFTATRTVLNTNYRMLYPFLPVFARALGVDLESMALVVTARQTLGILAPGVGSLADTRGRKWAMLVGLGLFSVGLLVIPLHPTYAVVLVALVIAMAGKLMFDPAMQAYLGDRVAYTQRGLAMALTELNWSGAGLIGVPLVGWLIASRGWVAPFPILGLLGLSAAGLLWVLIPADPPASISPPTLMVGFRRVVVHGPAMAGLAVSLLVTVANESVNIIYGAWLEGSFGLQVAALGAASAVIGLAELGGEGFSAALSDRIGKRRLVGLAIGANILAALGMPLLGTSLPGALLSLFLFYLTFEIVIVASIPMMSEILPSARATVMAANVAALSVGRAFGAVAGPPLLHLGLPANTLVTAILDLAALAMLILFVRLDEPRPAQGKG